jgi:hypothetical protein
MLLDEARSERVISILENHHPMRIDEDDDENTAAAAVGWVPIVGSVPFAPVRMSSASLTRRHRPGGWASSAHFTPIFLFRGTPLGAHPV